MPPALPASVLSLHNALVEERPLAMRAALAAGAHPLDRNADGKNVWEVLMSSSSLLRAQGTVANDFRQVLAGMAEIPPRTPEEAKDVLALEKQAIEQKYADLQRQDLAFLRDCLSLAARATWVNEFPFVQRQELVRQRHANQAFEVYSQDQAIDAHTQPGVAQALRRSSGFEINVPDAIEAYRRSVGSTSDEPALQLSGVKVSIPGGVGLPALTQKDATGKANTLSIVPDHLSSPEAAHSRPVLPGDATLKLSGQKVSIPNVIGERVAHQQNAGANRSLVEDPQALEFLGVHQRRARKQEETASPATPTPPSSRFKP